MIVEDYANIVHDLCINNQNIENEFGIFMQTIEDNQDFIKVLSSPRITLSDKKKIIDDTLVGFSVSFLAFLKVLIDHDHFNKIKDIYKTFINKDMVFKKVANVVVVSVNELNSSDLDLLKNNLKQFISANEINITNKINKSLIGGIQIIYNGKLSTSNWFEQLKSNLL